jgi:predicted ester cyclase
VSEENVDIVRRYLEQDGGRGSESALEQTVAEDAVDHNPAPGQPPGLEGFKGAVQAIRAGLPDLRTTVEDAFASGNKVAARWTSVGTHEGELTGVPATGKEVTSAASTSLAWRATR